MQRFTVHFADEAWQLIQAQVRYIAVENHAPENASRWLDRLLDAVGTLEQFPGRNPIDDRQTKLQKIKVHRMVFEKTYLIFYIVNETERRVDIISFRHGAQEQR